MNKNSTPDRKTRKAGEILILLLIFFTFASIAFALDFRYRAKVERVIDGDTTVVDLSLDLGVASYDQIVMFYGIDS